MRDRVKKFFHSIQGQFIFIFIGGAIFLLLVVSVVSYVVIYRTVQRINERATSAEFAQISVNLEGLFDNLKRQSESFLGNSSVRKLCAKIYEDEIDRIFSVNDFSNMVTDMIWHYPYIHSVYLYLDQEVLCATSTNMQRLIKPKSDSLIQGEYVQGLFLLGGIKAGDFPLSSNRIEKDELLVAVVRRVYSGYLVINIKEDYFNSLYADVSENGDGVIRILNSEGYIISSPDKNEIGEKYEYGAKKEMQKGDGQYLEQRKGIQVLWHSLADSSLIIVSEKKVSILYSELADVSYVVVFIFFVGLLILCLTFFLWMNRAFVPLKHIIENMEQVAESGEYHMIDISGKDRKISEMESLITHYNNMLGSLNEFKLRQEYATEELRKRELQVLRNQINPHFLFNTLNNIKWMSIISGVPHIAESLTALGGIVQPLFRSDAVMWTLREEMEQVSLYLKIENLRFQNRIKYHENIESEIKEIKILRFLLQPLIENSIVHGFSSSACQGDIWVDIYTKKDELFIEVADNGKGLSDNELDVLNEKLSGGKENGGIGLLNTSRRIQLYYGEKYGISVYHNTKVGKGLLEILTLPIM